VRIESITISRLRNLHDFSVTFEDDQFTTVLIGENGTGKSNLLEAIVQIFRDLDLGILPNFDYQIVYHCRGRRIHAIGKIGRRQLVYVNPSPDTKPHTWAAFQREKDELLPKYVFAYYSGPSKRMQHLFEAHQKQFYDRILNDDTGEAPPIRRLFYCQPEHSRWVLLAYFLRGNEPPAFLKRYFGIDSFDSALLVLCRPEWAKNWTQSRRPPADIQRLGDERFWWARGVVKSFLQRLWEQALSPIYSIEEYQADYRSRSTHEERIYLFLPGPEALQRLNTEYEDEAALFAALESTDISQLVRDVRVRVRRENESILFSELSEGEQQLLTVVGLMQFTRHAESLFLLDEPDTHLNPTWKLSYLTELARQSGLLSPDGEVDGGRDAWLDSSSQLILTTHDPLTIAGLKRAQVKIFQRVGNSTVADFPDGDPQGMGVAGVLIEMFGLPSTLDTVTQEKINRRNQLSRMSERSWGEELELGSLTAELRELGLVYDSRDPEYREYLKALHAWEEKNRVRVEDLSVEQQGEVVERLLADLLGKES
jgi:predicted ATPase